MDRIELNNLTRTYYDAQGETFCALDHAALIWEQGHSIAIICCRCRYLRQRKKHLGSIDDWIGTPL